MIVRCERKRKSDWEKEGSVAESEKETNNFNSIEASRLFVDGTKSDDELREEDFMRGASRQIWSKNQLTHMDGWRCDNKKKNGFRQIDVIWSF